MTDYLELLLGERQDEEEREGFTWRRAAGYRGPKGATGMDDTAEGAEAVGRSGPQEGRQGRQAQVQVEQTGRAELREQLVMLERAVARGKAQQAGQVRNRQGADQVRTVHGQDVRRLNTAAPGVQYGLAGLLDAEFQRDARRYDGPLGLF